MKENPKEMTIREDMEEGVLSQEGFLGDDTRSINEIIREDQDVLETKGISQKDLAIAMRRLMIAGQDGLGDPIEFEGYEVKVDEWRGKIACPFKDNHKTAKKIINVKRLSDGKDMCWSALSVHLIDHHCFFQGRGATYRLEPIELIDLLSDLL